MQETYHEGSRSSRPERRRVSHRLVIAEAKEKVPVIDLADLLCGPGKMRKVGERWIARCPLPNHEDRTPSFTVFPESNSWFCFGACLVGGDVIELARHAWGYSKQEAPIAAADLLHEFGHPIPERPASWYAKNKRQKPVRDLVDEAKIRHLQRRVFRIFQPMIEEIEDLDERHEEIEYLWDAAGEIAALILAGRKDA